MLPAPTLSGRGCSVADFGAVPDNATDNTHAFRAAAASGCSTITVPAGIWMTGPFNLSSHTTLYVEGTISGSRNPAVYPIVTQQPVDEAYRAPYMLNRQRQALVSAYSATNISLRGTGIVDGNGWDWWNNISSSSSNNICSHCMDPPHGQAESSQCPAACTIQRPKLVEFVDCTDVTVAGASLEQKLTLKDSPFWTL